MLPFNPVKKNWSSEIVYLIGGGPSIEHFPVSRLEGLTLGANKSAFYHDCDAIGSLDQTFVRRYYKEITEFVEKGKEAFLYMPVTEDGHEPIKGANYIAHDRGVDISIDPFKVYGVHTGYANLNFAFLAGAKQIGLLGYDMKPSTNGKLHCHEGYSWQNSQTPKYYEKWSRDFVGAARILSKYGVEVINFVGPEGSLITEFPSRPLEDLI